MHKTDPLSMLITLLVMPPILLSIGLYLSLVSRDTPGNSPDNPQFHGTPLSLILIIPAFFVVYAGGLLRYAERQAELVQYTQVGLSLLLAYLIPKSDILNRREKGLCAVVLLAAAAIGTCSIVLSTHEDSPLLLRIASFLTILSPALPSIASGTLKLTGSGQIKNGEPVDRKLALQLAGILAFSVLLGIALILLKVSPTP